MKKKSLAEHIEDHFALHFAKRLAYMDENGSPPKWILTDPRHVYVQAAGHRHTLLRAAIEDSRVLIKQAENPPPNDWLSSIGLTRDKYIQQIVDLFTLLLHSTADRVLLLTNAVLNLQIEPRKLSLKEVSKKLHNQGDVIAALQSVHSCISHLSDHRNQFAHRGEHRFVGQFSNVTRMRVILKKFNYPSDQVLFPDLEALQRLKADMLAELSSVETVLEQAVESLLPSYISRIESFGGPDTPNADETARAGAALAYFKGGTRPPFMDAANLSMSSTAKKSGKHMTSNDSTSAPQRKPLGV